VITIVDVIIPTYKARETLPKALDSLVAQTKKLFIVTVVQDGDGEDYSDIIEEYRRRGLQLYLISLKENNGPGFARQAGIDANKMCDYLMFLDADDLLMPRAIEILYREAKLHNADIISSNFIAEKRGTSGYLMDVSLRPVTWFHGNIYKASYLREKNIRFLSSLRYNEDSYFNLVAFNCTENKYKIKEITYLWRDNKNSITRSGDKPFFFKGWRYYIDSQVEGLLKIIEIKNEVNPSTLGVTLNLVYSYWMIAKYLNLIDDEIKESLGRLKNKPQLLAAIKDEAFWDYVSKNIKGCQMWEDHLIFYQDRFNDWMKEYIAEEL
jgi:glycosyltransferase involved in cell wall biosynthesis